MDKLKIFLALKLMDNKYPALHGMRVLGLLSVFQAHTSMHFLSIGYIQLDHNFVKISLSSWFGVDLFFIMSGFLIGNILYSSFDNNKEYYLKRFYVRRAFRILPLYYAFALAYNYHNIVMGASGGRKLNYVKELLYLSNYPFLPNDYLIPWSWSLSVEEHFYLLCPLLILFLQKLSSHKIRLAVLVGLWVSGTLVRLSIYFNHANWSGSLLLSELYTPTHARYDILIAGVILAYLHQHFDSELNKLFKRPGIRFMSVIVPVGIFAAMVYPGHNTNPLGFFQQPEDINLNETAWRAVFYYGTLTSLAYFLLMSWAIYTKNWATHFLGSRVFMYLAALGYGIYLVHIPAGLYITKWFPQTNLTSNPYLYWLVTNALIFAFAASLAYILHVFIEKPFIALRDRIAP